MKENEVVELEEELEEELSEEEVKEAKERRAQIPSTDVIQVFVLKQFDTDKVGGKFGIPAKEVRNILRREFNDKLPKNGGIRVSGVELQKSTVEFARKLFGQAYKDEAKGNELANKCKESIAQLFADMRVGGSGRKLDKAHIIATLNYEMLANEIEL